MYNKKYILIILTVIFSKLSFAAHAQQIIGYNERAERQEIEMRRLVGEVEKLKFENRNFKVQLKGLKNELKLSIKDLQDQINKQNHMSNSSAHHKKIDSVDTTLDIADDLTEKKTPIDLKKPFPSIQPPKKISDLKKSKQNIVVASDTTQVIYKKAQGFLHDKKYVEAESHFKKIIKKNPKHKLTPNAYYWLGETYYARKNYKQAALTFLKGKQEFPASAKAGHNLLKLGLSLHYLKQKTEACHTFTEVRQKYINKDPSLEKTLSVSEKKAQCT